MEPATHLKKVIAVLLILWASSTSCVCEQVERADCVTSHYAKSWYLMSPEEQLEQIYQKGLFLERIKEFKEARKCFEILQGESYRLDECELHLKLLENDVVEKLPSSSSK